MRAPLLLALTLVGCREPAAPDLGGAAAPSPAAWDSAGASGAAGGAAREAVAGEAGEAVAALRPVGTGEASGTVRLTRFDAGVRVLAEVAGLDAEGLHALHVLAATSCDDASDAPLFDPDRAPHGSPYDARGMRKAGGLGNLRAGAGRARFDRVDPVLALDGARSAVGRAVVVRAGQDDSVTEPDGAAGGVLACGVIATVR